MPPFRHGFGVHAVVAVVEIVVSGGTVDNRIDEDDTRSPLVEALTDVEENVLTAVAENVEITELVPASPTDDVVDGAEAVDVSTTVEDSEVATVLVLSSANTDVVETTPDVVLGAISHVSP